MKTERCENVKEYLSMIGATDMLAVDSDFRGKQTIVELNPPRRPLRPQDAVRINPFTMQNPILLVDLDNDYDFTLFPRTGWTDEGIVRKPGEINRVKVTLDDACQTVGRIVIYGSSEDLHVCYKSDVRANIADRHFVEQVMRMRKAQDELDKYQKLLTVR